MKAEDAWVDLLDRFHRGQLTDADKIDLENKMISNEGFQQFAAQHGVLMSALKNYEKKKALHDLLDETHLELESDSSVLPIPQRKQSFIGRYWPITAVAASLTLFVAVTIMYFSAEKQSVVEYKELRKTVDRLQKSQKQMMEEIKENTKPEVPPGKYSGTGFFISAKGFLATSYHVVKDADSVYIMNEKFGRMKVSVIFSDLKKDIAILEVDDKSSLPRALPYLIAKDEADLGEAVYTLGYPREDIVFGEGSISALSGFRQNPDAYQMSVPVNPGNSGGPLFNSHGDLVGIISGLQTQTHGAAFAMKSSILHNVLSDFPQDSLAKKIVFPVRNNLKSHTRVEQVKRWKDFVFMVAVYNN
jgi:serine protease Do